MANHGHAVRHEWLDWIQARRRLLLATALGFMAGILATIWLGGDEQQPAQGPGAGLENARQEAAQWPGYAAQPGYPQTNTPWNDDSRQNGAPQPGTYQDPEYSQSWPPQYPPQAPSPTWNGNGSGQQQSQPDPWNQSRPDAWPSQRQDANRQRTFGNPPGWQQNPYERAW